jgi:hypothetical protein
VDLFGQDDSSAEPDRRLTQKKASKPPGKKRRMARSDLLVALVKAGATGDRNLARTSAEALIADERAKHHNVLADRLSGALKAQTNGHQLMASPPSESAARGPSTRDLLVERAPHRNLADLLLPPVTREACEELIEEQRRADVLRAHGLEPRHRILLAGLQGMGRLHWPRLSLKRSAFRSLRFAMKRSSAASSAKPPAGFAGSSTLRAPRRACCSSTSSTSSAKSAATSTKPARSSVS